MTASVVMTTSMTSLVTVPAVISVSTSISRTKNKRVTYKDTYLLSCRVSYSSLNVQLVAILFLDKKTSLSAWERNCVRLQSLWPKPCLSILKEKSILELNLHSTFLFSALKKSMDWWSIPMMWPYSFSSISSQKSRKIKTNCTRNATFSIVKHQTYYTVQFWWFFVLRRII